jgi:hypothetical protein
VGTSIFVKKGTMAAVEVGHVLDPGKIQVFGHAQSVCWWYADEGEERVEVGGGTVRRCLVWEGIERRVSIFEGW